MARHNLQTLCIGAAASAVILFLPLWSFTMITTTPKSDVVCGLQARAKARIETGRESKDPTFYDDNTTTLYSIDEPVIAWDEKRSRWFELHPTFSPSENRLLVVTGSRPPACRSSIGDHFLLRSFKNKVDYCRIHGYNVFYSDGFSNWAVIRAAMVAHPQVEWLLWAEAHVVYTDMDFEIPLERYKDHNLVVHGRPEAMKMGPGSGPGLFLIRNCEWSMQFLDIWAGMGPGPEYRKWGGILESTFKDMIYVENLNLEGDSWRDVVGRFEEFGGMYGELEKRVVALRRRHAEMVGGGYAAERGRQAEEGGWRRPFVTDFSGCRWCGGKNVSASCAAGMERALNFADNQVLRNYGFVHPNLGSASFITSLSSSYRRARFGYLN
ncbi:putative glycosyltransferase 7 [Salvia miltiorrhiza]|uniref:putative glycosyltransferase 7 n=1 Tax=Salvia miltiorrhiza TaxID=226208 RepID=UPI0025AC8373|nr:putative glycosyltransferase 7 [Salvia miltiorrhiza]